MDAIAKNMAMTRWDGYGSDWPDGNRLCRKCSQVQPNENFHKHKRCKGGYNSVCKTCRLPLSLSHYAGISQEARLFSSAKGRAKRKGREFSIALSDVVVPEICPVFNIPMTSPSIDRIDSSKGYTKGNIRVISVRANNLKNNATIKEMEMVLADLRRLAGVVLAN